ncbi:hypothetical protein NIES2111_59880 (plasmid) [Nostoc sp. NIES-2111]|nr:hypothetical protein NIES2111_59880 [Nostoc sp. NIES-2111]
MKQNIIQGYSEAEQKRVVEGAYQLGITPDDPSFRMMATLGRYEETVINIQARTEAMIEAFPVLVEQKMDDTTIVVCNVVRDEISKNKPKSSVSKIQLGGWGIGSLSTICALVAGASALVASLTTWNVVSNMGASQSVVVSANDLKILQWAKSPEGKQLYEILLNNQEAIEACRREHRARGYCFIQTEK